MNINIVIILLICHSFIKVYPEALKGRMEEDLAKVRISERNNRRTETSSVKEIYEDIAEENNQTRQLESFNKTNNKDEVYRDFSFSSRFH
jgi:hypothetical protein